MLTSRRNRALGFTLATLVTCAVARGSGPSEGPSWKAVRTEQLPGFQVSLSEPVLVARDRGYLWFPTLARLANGDLLAVMSNYADAHTTESTSLVCWSRDGGLTWSQPVKARYGDSHVRLPGGDELLLPYYLSPAPDGMAAPYQLVPRGRQELRLIKDGITVTGWPQPDEPIDARRKLSGFVFNGQPLALKGGGYLTTLYGHFRGEKRYSLVAAESPDGTNWKVRTVIAGADCKLDGREGPCEAALARLKDGRLLCVFRLASNVPYGQAFSSDEGRTWSDAVAMPGVFSVQPSLAVLADGTVVLSGGRPGLFVWVNRAGDGQEWQRLDLGAHHNACRPREPIDRPDHSSSYTEVVALDEENLLVIYDRVPHGWKAIPQDSDDTNSVWVVRLTLRREPR